MTRLSRLRWVPLTLLALVIGALVGIVPAPLVGVGLLFVLVVSFAKLSPQHQEAIPRRGIGTELGHGLAQPRESGGVSDVIYALVLLQGALGVLASFGMIALMGSPVYLVMPLIELAALAALAARAAGGRRWAVITLIAIEGVALAAYGLSATLGLLLPQLTWTMNLVGLLNDVALPAAIIRLCTGLLTATRQPLPDASGTRPVPAPANPETSADQTPASTLRFARPIVSQR